MSYVQFPGLRYARPYAPQARTRARLLMMRLIDLHEACDPTRESGLPGQEQRMASAEVYAFHDTPSIPLPLPLPQTNGTGRPLHRNLSRVRARKVCCWPDDP